MPYSSNAELPSAVRELPEHAQSVFRAAFNNAFHEYGHDETKAFKVAWAAVAKWKHANTPAYLRAENESRARETARVMDMIDAEDKQGRI